MIRRNFPITAAIVIILLAAGACLADEGMWPLYDLDKLPFDSLRAKGLMLDRDEIFNPGKGGLSDAAISVGSSASFVSADGLIVTNHHVAAGAAQRQSTVESNILRDGFYAATRAEEIPAIGYNAYVTLAVDDVTDRIAKTLNDDMTDMERYLAIEAGSKKIIKEAEKDRDVECELVKMFGGKQFILYTYFKIKDVRIVYFPPDAIGNFGGDIDNWMWPRHVGDFAFLRAYVAPDGSSAHYSPENVPYHPNRFFAISARGVREGDFVMMFGFPGKTRRYASSHEIAYLQNEYYPEYIRTSEDRIAILEKLSDADSATAIRVASKMSGINNYLKKSRGIMEGFQRSDILRKKQKYETGLLEYIKNHPEMSRHANILDQFAELYRKKRMVWQKDRMLDLLTYASDYLGMAEEIYRWADERQKDDADREIGYQDRDSVTTKRWLREKQVNLVPAADREMLKYLINRARTLPDGQKIDTIEKLFAGRTGTDADDFLESFLDNLFANTDIGDLDQRMRMFYLSRADLDKSDDACIKFIAQLYPEIKAMRKRDKEMTGAESRLMPKLAMAYADWKQTDIYPDANSTKRFNYGFVKGYSPRDAVSYTCRTTLTGVMEKETGREPFIVPEELKAVYKNRDYGEYLDPVLNDVPVNFISTNSGTNGNSGSPVLNGRGELVGLDFDTGYEGVSADYMYNPDVCRAVVCDTRYMLFLIDKVYHLDNLLNELTIR